MDRKNKEIRLLFGQNLRLARKSKRLSQQELAQMIGIKQNTISMYEKGLSHPDPGIQELLIKKLEVTRDFLFDNIKKYDIIEEDNEPQVKDRPSSYTEPQSLIDYLELLEARNEIDHVVIGKLKSYALGIYKKLTEDKEDLVKQYKKYEDLRDYIKKELNLPI